MHDLGEIRDGIDVWGSVCGCELVLGHGALVAPLECPSSASDRFRCAVVDSQTWRRPTWLPRSQVAVDGVVRRRVVRVGVGPFAPTARGILPDSVVCEG